MQVRTAHPAKIRIIRGGKKKTHSPAFVKFETFVFKAAHAAKIRIIRGGKKKTHSSAFVKFEIFVFKKTPRFMRALLFRFPLESSPTPNS